MIQIQDVTKRFGQIEAVSDLSMDIPEGTVFGLVGTNGAGKSTLLRMLAGVLRPDTGEIRVDGQAVYENEDLKSEICYLSDEGYFFPNATGLEMARFVETARPDFDMNRFHRLMHQFSLDEDRRVQTFSKGMKKQLSVVLGLATGARILLCDETFDGLDPVMRQAVKSLFASEVLDRPFTPVIASHNLRELEDICDRVGLLHRGGILFAQDLDDLKQNLHKIQCVVRDAEKEAQLFRSLTVLKSSRQGSLLMLTVRGTKAEIETQVNAVEPLFAEIIPLSLEEIFISETEVAGYEVKDLLF